MHGIPRNPRFRDNVCLVLLYIIKLELYIGRILNRCAKHKPRLALRMLLTFQQAIDQRSDFIIQNLLILTVNLCICIGLRGSGKIMSERMPSDEHILPSGITHFLHLQPGILIKSGQEPIHVKILKIRYVLLKCIHQICVL